MSRWAAPVGVGLMFATNGAAFASVLPWYPALKIQWQLTDLVFGIVVAAVAVGSIVSAGLPAWVESKIGPRRTVLLGTVAICLAVAGIGWVPNAAVLALVLAVFGALDAVVDVSQNVAAVRVETRLKRSLMSTFHACWSLGAVFGSLASTASASAGVDIRVHLGVAAAVILAAVCLAAVLVGPVPETPAPETGAEAPAPGARILVLALPVALVAISGALVEEVANNWAALAAVDLADQPVATSGTALSVILAAQFIGRITGDPLIQRFGRAAVARAGGVLIGLGGIAVVSASSSVVLYIGLALAGLGCATLVPSAYAAAAAIPGARPSTGVTAVSWMMRVSALVVNPLIGLLSAATSLRVALGVLAVAGVVAVFFAGALRGGTRESSAPLVENKE